MNFTFFIFVIFVSAQVSLTDINKRASHKGTRYFLRNLSSKKALWRKLSNRPQPEIWLFQSKNIFFQEPETKQPKGHVWTMNSLGYNRGFADILRTLIDYKENAQQKLINDIEDAVSNGYQLGCSRFFSFGLTERFLTSCTGFQTISQFLERILMKHIQAI